LLKAGTSEESVMSRALLVLNRVMCCYISEQATV